MEDEYTQEQLEKAKLRYNLRLQRTRDLSAKAHPILNWFNNLILGTALNADPAAATSVGWKRDKNGNVYLDKIAIYDPSSPESELRDNLAAISSTALAPAAKIAGAALNNPYVNLYFGYEGLRYLPEDLLEVFERSKNKNWLGTKEGWDFTNDEADAGVAGALLNVLFDRSFIKGGARAFKELHNTKWVPYAGKLGELFSKDYPELYKKMQDWYFKHTNQSVRPVTKVIHE